MYSHTIFLSDRYIFVLDIIYVSMVSLHHENIWRKN